MVGSTFANIILHALICGGPNLGLLVLTNKQKAKINPLD